MKKVILSLLVVAGLIGLIAAIALYVQLQRSYREGEAIESRAVSTEKIVEIKEKIDKSESVGEDEESSAEELPEQEGPKLLASGEFVEVDPIHWANGTVQIIESDESVYIKFLPGFEAANGPDLYIHLSGEQEYGGARGASIEPTLNLGKIQAKEGEQVYKVSREEWEQYNHSVLIWCRAFGIHFSHALLDS